MGNPLAACSFALLAFGAGHRPLHAARDAGFGSNRDVGLHSALPQRAPAKFVRRVDGAPDAILVDPHIAVGHRDRVDVGIDESLVPRHRVGDAVDVIPAPRVVADEVRAERGADLHQLETGFELLDEHVDLDCAGGKTQARFERGEDVVPKRRFLGGLNLRQIQNQRGIVAPQLLLVVHDKKRHVNDGC